MNDSHDAPILLWRHKLLMMTVFVVTAGAVFVASGMLPPRYETQASLLVRLGREFAYRPEVGTGSGSMLDLDEIVNSEVAILESRDLSRSVVEEVGPAVMYPDLAENVDGSALVDAAVSKFRDDLTVRGVEQSSVIRLRFQHVDSGVAAGALNALLEQFELKHLELFRDPRSEFLGERLEVSEAALRKAEDSLESLRQEFGIFDLPEQKKLLLARRSELVAARRTDEARLAQLVETMARLGVEDPEEAPTLSIDSVSSRRSQVTSRRDDLNDTLRETEFRLEQIRHSLEATADHIPANGSSIAAEPQEETKAIQEAWLLRLELELQRRELRKTFAPTSREILNVQERIDLIDDFLQHRSASTVAKERDALIAEKATLEARRGWLSSDLEAATEELEELSRQEVLAEARLIRGRLDPLAEQIERCDEEIQRLDAGENGLQRIERDVLAKDRRVQELSRLHDEARISDELDSLGRLNVKVIERASVPSRPIELSTKMQILLSAGAGLAAAAAIGVLFGMRRRPSF